MLFEILENHYLHYVLTLVRRVGSNAACAETLLSADLRPQESSRPSYASPSVLTASLLVLGPLTAYRGSASQRLGLPRRGWAPVPTFRVPRLHRVRPGQGLSTICLGLWNAASKPRRIFQRARPASGALRDGRQGERVEEPGLRAGEGRRRVVVDIHMREQNAGVRYYGLRWAASDALVRVVRARARAGRPEGKSAQSMSGSRSRRSPTPEGALP
ncbi:hypothetical protein OH76DRAFT_795746 [Lentinus brumalis]|uniref:Uncharacterized protein n=1 Tax=Lentinus brumalis TaxID=2498619 RepID=A0A371D3M5_9APHY|nr:hypothetical protein OH76DRAFT_795746 [Polyporus brumalis]